MNKKYIIEDWAGNILDFRGQFESPSFVVPIEFKTFEDAWEFIYQKFPNDEEFDDYFVVLKGE